MTEQLWAIGGVVVGILATGGKDVLVDRVKLRQSSAETKRAAARERCEAFLAEVESEEQAASGYYEQHGIMPGNAGYEETTAKARARLTELELHCPTKLYEAGRNLVDLLEGWAFGDKNYEAYQSARKDFVRIFHQLL